jgi:two-component system CheB/CheR fusion protein
MRRIVMVEDNSDSRDMLYSLLMLEGYEVTAARDGAEGLQLILAQQPEVALIDIGLPEIDGYEVARRVRRTLGPGVLLIALTGYGRDEDRQAVKAAGFDEHLVKPLDPEDLFRILSRRPSQA